MCKASIPLSFLPPWTTQKRLTSSLTLSTSSASNTASTSSNFEVLFSAALEKYTKQTGKDLRNHPLASEINSCDSPDSTLHLFQEQAKAFDEFRRGDTKLFKWLKPVVNVLHALSTNEVLRDSVSHVSLATFISFIPFKLLEPSTS